MAQPHDAGPVYVSEYDYPVKLTFAGQLFCKPVQSFRLTLQALMSYIVNRHKNGG